MIQPRPLADLAIHRIASAVAERLRPRRIILFGSRARGDAAPDSDYDIMVEIEMELSYRDCWAAVRSAVPPGIASVDIVVRAPGELEARRDDPGTLDWDIAREGVVVYPVGWGRLPRPPLRVRESGPNPPKSVAAWIARAEVDLRVIDGLLLAGLTPWPGVCFHAQQAAEKYLKAVLVRRWIKPPRSHDLEEILVAVRAAVPSFPDFAADCRRLAPYAVDPRYPEDSPLPGEVEGGLAIEAMRRIVEAARVWVRSP